MIFQERVIHRRQEEFDRRREEREEQINQMIQARKLDREARRKKTFYVRSEEERLRKIQEEEEARKREGIIFTFHTLSKKISIFIGIFSVAGITQIQTNICCNLCKGGISMYNIYVWFNAFYYSLVSCYLPKKKKIIYQLRPHVKNSFWALNFKFYCIGQLKIFLTMD